VRASYLLSAMSFPLFVQVIWMISASTIVGSMASFFAMSSFSFRVVFFFVSAWVA